MSLALIVSLGSAGVIMSGIIALILIVLKADFKVWGVKFLCQPTNLSSKICKDEIAEMLLTYANGMAKVFNVQIGDILNHYKELVCIFQYGTLNHELDSQVDKNVVGIARNQNKIFIGILDEMLDEDRMVDIHRTAFWYELHNSAIMRFVGPKVAYAEPCIKPGDKRAQVKLGTDKGGLAQLRKKRKKYDRVFMRISKDLMRD